MGSYSRPGPGTHSQGLSRTRQSGSLYSHQGMTHRVKIRALGCDCWWPLKDNHNEDIWFQLRVSLCPLNQLRIFPLRNNPKLCTKFTVSKWVENVVYLKHNQTPLATARFETAVYLGPSFHQKHIPGSHLSEVLEICDLSGPDYLTRSKTLTENIPTVYS